MITPRIVVVLAVPLVLVLGACSSTPVNTAPTTVGASAAPPAGSAYRSSTQGSAAAATPESQVATVSVPAYLDPTSQIAKDRSVYFDYDDYAVGRDDLALIELQGKYLAAHPAVAIRIEGNTDERGGLEYNLALGQKRAEAVLRALKVYNVRDGQMEAVSWGESKPMASTHDESAWAKNRRADLQYPQR